jgi:CheY-like chemotaxis protein
MIAVRSGEEAVEYLAGEGNYRNREEYPLPELVLLDLKMTGMDGFDVLKWIRAQPTLKGLRVVVLTSSELVYDVNQAYALGANSFLVKPSSFENFNELIQSMSGYWLWTSKAPELHRPPKPVPNGNH